MKNTGKRKIVKVARAFGFLKGEALEAWSVWPAHTTKEIFGELEKMPKSFFNAFLENKWFSEKNLKNYLHL